MGKIKFSKDEKKRLEKIKDAFDYHFQIDLKEYLANVGKFQAFAAAVTEDDKVEQKNLIRGLLLKPEPESTIDTLKLVNIFASAVRRVEDDTVIAKQVPAGKLDAQDVVLLQKIETPALAALAQARLSLS